MARSCGTGEHRSWTEPHLQAPCISWIQFSHFTFGDTKTQNGKAPAMFSCMVGPRCVNSLWGAGVSHLYPVYTESHHTWLLFSWFPRGLVLSWNILFWHSSPRSFWCDSGQRRWEVYETGLYSFVKAYPVIGPSDTVDRIKEWIQPRHLPNVSTRALQWLITELQKERWDSGGEAVGDGRDAGIREAWVHTPLLLFADTVALGRFPFYTETVSSSTE